MSGSLYAEGGSAWGLCNRCGLRFLLRDLVFDGYMPGLRVCEDCADPKHPQEFPILISDPLALYKPTPDDAPMGAVLSLTSVNNNTVTLAWTDANSNGGPRYESYILSRAFSPDGVTYGPYVSLGSSPITYADSLDLDGPTFGAVNNGMPPIGDDTQGITADALGYVDTVSALGYYDYLLAAIDGNGNGPSSNVVTAQVLSLVGRRLLEGGGYRLLEDGVSKRDLELGS